MSNIKKFSISLIILILAVILTLLILSNETNAAEWIRKYRYRD